MKKLMLLINLFVMSTTTFALGCGNLGIKIINATNKECVLKSKGIYYGLPDRGYIPSSIPSGTTSDEFFMRQDDTGIGIQLGYQCGDKKVKFYSYQEYCGWYAGDVGGIVDVWNELDAMATPVFGSWLASTPGRITWLIH